MSGAEKYPSWKAELNLMSQKFGCLTTELMNPIGSFYTHFDPNCYQASQTFGAKILH